MPTLSQAPLSRLAALRRAPFWAQALAACALFAVAGVVVVDDYGVDWDEVTQREIARSNADYVTTGNTAGLYNKDFRYYGAAFETALMLPERALGLQDTRQIHLTRHLLIHLFFIAGGFACGMLAYRMLGSRWVALLAMTLFLLHPRLYAQSFFNSKDMPFAAMLLIALYLAHRAFRKDTIGAFLLCGIGVGLAINLRPFGLMLLPMILVMRAPDLWRAGSAERKRILLTGAAFLAATLGTVYIIHPYYWENPLRFIEGVHALSQHPTIAPNLFMGKIYLADAVPWNYIPVWFAITAPPAALALGAVGCAAVFWQGIAHPLAALRCRETRFRILSLGCFALPVVVVIALQSNIYSGWRQMYFLWAPFCLLAAIGLHTIANIRMGRGIWKVGARLPSRVRGCGYRLHRTRRALAYGVAGVGLATTLAAMAALHPHQQVYFNGLADTRTPGALGERYDLDHTHVTHLQLLEHLLARYPEGKLRVYPPIPHASARILRSSDRERIDFTRAHDADFYFSSYLSFWRDAPDPPMIHSIRAYGSVVSYIIAPSSAAYREHYRAAYEDVEANGTLLARAGLDVYIHNGALHYLSADCAPLLADAKSGVFLHIFPADPADLPADGRELGFENRDFRIAWRDALVTHTGFADGKCVTQRPLPDYAIERISTGQFVIGGDDVWRADVDLAARAAAEALYGRIAAGDYGRPAARSDFDVYLREGGLAYLKENCDQSDVDARFFLHIFPADPADLPADGREVGFVNMDFRFGDYGAYAGDACVAERELPGYAIGRIRTGQFVSGEGDVWRVEFAARR